MTYKSNTKARTSTDYLTVHCSATKPSMKVDAAMIDRWHRGNGWACIGYHKVIKRDGTIEDGRDIDVIGAHVANHNSNSVGICMAGGVAEKDGLTPENNFTDAQFVALEGLLRELKVKYPKAKVMGHKDFPGVKKACPSFEIIAWAKAKGI